MPGPHAQGKQALAGKPHGGVKTPPYRMTITGALQGAVLTPPRDVYGKRLSPGRLRAGRARPLQDNSKNRDTGPCGPVSLLLMRFYAFLKPTLCMNLTKAA